ncbi:MAG: LEA type 2 family protein [Tidjanibacter sp.]|nr:LEA type 2 family protein [Tidjanibacter sp.]
MRHRIVRLLLLAATTLSLATLTGCNLISLDSFLFRGAKVVDFKLTEGARVEMTIENRSLFKVTIVGGELAAYNGTKPLGEIYLKSPIVLPRKSTTTVTLDVGLRFSSPMAALGALGAVTSSPDKVTVSGYGEGKVWLFHKRFERRDVPLSKFIAIFGDVSNYIK